MRGRREPDGPGFSGGRFCLRFLAFLTLAFAAPLLAPVHDLVVRPWNHALVAATAAAVAAAGIEARALAGSVTGPGFALEVVDACNGLDATLVFAAAVLALPAAWRFRLGAVVAGASLLLVVNVGRLAGLYWVGLVHPAWLEPAHLYAGQAGMILVSLLIWMRVLARAVGHCPAHR